MPTNIAELVVEQGVGKTIDLLDGEDKAIWGERAKRGLLKIEAKQRNEIAACLHCELVRVQRLLLLNKTN